MSMFVWRGRNVLVTGASGFVGSWLVKELIEQGANVVGLVRDWTPNSRFETEHLRDRVAVVNASVEDLDSVRRACAEYEIDTVFHLAAQAIVGSASRDPVGTLRANIMGTWNVLEAARNVGVKRVIVASSDKAYGNNTDLPYLETHPLRGIYPYDVSKSCADLISAMYAHTYHLKVAITRCGNIFGGGDLNFNRLIPGAILAAMQGRRFLIRSDGKFVRDFIYVKDAVEAYLVTARALAEGTIPAGEAFNFSLELRLTVLELVHRVLELMNRTDLEPEILNQVSTEIREQYLSAAKARRLLGWQPAYTLDGGLKDTIEWYTQEGARRGWLDGVEGRVR